MSLGQRQPAGVGEQFAEENRLVMDRELVGGGNIEEGLVADIRPGRLERKVILNGLGHADSATRFRGIPTEQTRLRKAIHTRCRPRYPRRLDESILCSFFNMLFG